MEYLCAEFAAGIPGKTDGRTDTFLIARPRWHQHSAAGPPREFKTQNSLPKKNSQKFPFSKTLDFARSNNKLAQN